MQRLTRNQKLELAKMKAYQDDYSITFDGVYWTDRLSRTHKSLLKRGLVTQGAHPTTNAFIILKLTEEGEEVVRREAPIKWVRGLKEYKGSIGATYYIKKLPLEELPEFLASPRLVERWSAQIRLEELTSKGTS